MCIHNKSNKTLSIVKPAVSFDVRFLLFFCFDWWDSVATRCRLDGPGIEYRWGAKFIAPVLNSPGFLSASYKMRTWSFLGVERQWRGVNYFPTPTDEIKERIEIYLCAFAVFYLL